MDISGPIKGHVATQIFLKKISKCEKKNSTRKTKSYMQKFLVRPISINLNEGNFPPRDRGVFLCIILKTKEGNPGTILRMSINAKCVGYLCATPDVIPVPGESL